MPNWIKVAKSSQIRERSGFAAKVGEHKIALFRDLGNVYAVRDFCPHQGGPLSDGYVQNGCITCLYHDWKFRISDGAFVNNELLRLTVFPVKEENGEIFIDLKDQNSPDSVL